MTTVTGQGSRTAGEDMSLVYGFYPTSEQESILRSWHGHVRWLHNSRKFRIPSVDDKGYVAGELVRLIAEHEFLAELPSSVVGNKLLELTEVQYADTVEVSSKKDLQCLCLSGQDFDITAQATVSIPGLGNLDVEFNEGPPQPDAFQIRLMYDPKCKTGTPHTIHIQYRGANHSG